MAMLSNPAFNENRAAYHNPDTCGNEINLGKGLAKYLPERGTEGEC